MATKKEVAKRIRKLIDQGAEVGTDELELLKEMLEEPTKRWPRYIIEFHNGSMVFKVHKSNRANNVSNTNNSVAIRPYNERLARFMDIEAYSSMAKFPDEYEMAMINGGYVEITWYTVDGFILHKVRIVDKTT